MQCCVADGGKDGGDEDSHDEGECLCIFSLLVECVIQFWSDMIEYFLDYEFDDEVRNEVHKYRQEAQMVLNLQELENCHVD